MSTAVILNFSLPLYGGKRKKTNSSEKIRGGTLSWYVESGGVMRKAAAISSNARGPAARHGSPKLQLSLKHQCKKHKAVKLCRAGDGALLLFGRLLSEEKAGSGGTIKFFWTIIQQIDKI